MRRFLLIIIFLFLALCFIVESKNVNFSSENSEKSLDYNVNDDIESCDTEQSKYETTSIDNNDNVEATPSPVDALIIAVKFINEGKNDKAELICDSIVNATANTCDSLAKVAFWGAKLYKGVIRLKSHRPLPPITYSDYLKSKKDVGELSAHVGMQYLIYENLQNLNINDSTLLTLNEILPTYLLSLSNDPLNNSDTKLMFSALCALNHNMSMSRSLCSDASQAFTNTINESNDTETLNFISETIERYMPYFDSLWETEFDKESKKDRKYFDVQFDSISYSLAKIRSKLLETKLLLDLKTDKTENLKKNFFDYKQAICFWDTIHYRNFIEEYLERIDEIKGKESWLYTFIGYYYTLVLPKGDDYGKQFFEELLAIQRKNGDYNYDTTLKDYYNYIGDYESLYQLEIQEFNATDNSDLSGIISSYIQRGEKNMALVEATEKYFNLYPEIKFDIIYFGMFSNFMLSYAPHSAFKSLENLLNKAEGLGNNNDILQIIVSLCSDGHLLCESTKRDLHLFLYNQLNSLSVFREDKSLRMHYEILLSEFYDYGNPEKTSFLPNIILQADNPNDKAEFIFLYAINSDLSHSRIDEIKNAISHFEKSESLTLTTEYKALLSTLFEMLDPQKDMIELLELYNKIINLRTEWGLLETFRIKYGLDFFLFNNCFNLYQPLCRHDDITMKKLSFVLENAPDISELKSVLIMTYNNLLNNTISNLKKSGYWEHQAKDTAKLMSTITKSAHRYPECDSLALLAYDASLLCKGMLLRAEGSLYSLLEHSDNDDILQKYHRALDIKNQIDEAHNAGELTDSLQIAYNQAFYSMVSAANMLGSFTSVLDYKCKDIASKLSSGDVAIEFSSVVTDEYTRYYAICLKGGYALPQVIELCTESQLQEVVSPYSTSEIYQLLWHPLECVLEGSDNLYFSPAGILHQIAIEYAPTPNGKLMSEQMNIHRLSNTIELAKNRKNNIFQDKYAVLFGGILYEGHEEILAPEYCEKRSRFGIDYLPGTKVEVEGISKVLNEAGYQVEKITGGEATEYSVKCLSKNDISILHLATHGFYMLGDNPNYANKHDDALLRSGLYMAGAANTLYGISDNYEFDDGILTARDIAELDLSAIDLVVLSACDTGLGDISAEGVFGLQRGFKKAGVNSLLMSLWPVSDEATQILMIRFYHNLVKGFTKSEALKEAQYYLRTVEDGLFDNPEYWASFILLDALDQ